MMFNIGDIVYDFDLKEPAYVVGVVQSNSNTGYWIRYFNEEYENEDCFVAYNCLVKIEKDQ